MLLRPPGDDAGAFLGVTAALQGRTAAARAFMKNHSDIDVVMIAPISFRICRVLAGDAGEGGLGSAENWLSATVSSNAPVEIDPTWQGEIPRTLLIARDGASPRSRVRRK